MSATELATVGNPHYTGGICHGPMVGAQGNSSLTVNHYLRSWALYSQRMNRSENTKNAERYRRRHFAGSQEDDDIRGWALPEDRLALSGSPHPTVTS
jgi:hypothetical protein